MFCTKPGLYTEPKLTWFGASFFFFFCGIKRPNPGDETTRAGVLYISTQMHFSLYQHFGEKNRWDKEQRWNLLTNLVLSWTNLFILSRRWLKRESSNLLQQSSSFTKSLLPHQIYPSMSSMYMSIYMLVDSRISKSWIFTFKFQTVFDAALIR